MKAIFAFLLGAAASTFGPGRASASFDTLLQIAQPMADADEGTIKLQYVTYMASFGSAWPGVEMQFTCSPGYLHRPQRTADGKRDSVALEQANEAFRAGIRVDVENRYDWRSWNSRGSEPPGARWGSKPGDVPEPYVDTIRVTLHCGSAARNWPAAGSHRDFAGLGGFEKVLRSTVDCLLDNAARSSIPIRHVLLKVDGPAALRRLGRLYTIKPSTFRRPVR